MKLEIILLASAAAPGSDKKILPRKLESLKAVANEQLELFIDGVKYTGAELIKGKPIKLKKDKTNLVFEVEDTPFAVIENFFDTEGVSLDGLEWDFPQTQFLKLDDTGLVALADDTGELKLAALPIIAASGASGLAGC